MQAALLLAACSQPPTLPELAPDASVLAFGDSLTAGTGADDGESYPAQLQALTDRRVINAGVPGETTAQGRERLAAALERHRPDLVLLCLGGNDFLRKLPAEATRANLAAMIERLQARRIPVALLAVPKLTVLGGPHPMYEALGERYDVPVLTDSLNAILREPGLKADRVHPNAAGYERLAAELAAFLRTRGALPSGS